MKIKITILILLVLLIIVGIKLFDKKELDPIIEQIVEIEREKTLTGTINILIRNEWDFIVLTKAYPLMTKKFYKRLKLSKESKEEFERNAMSYEMRQIYYIKDGKIIYFEPFNMYLEFEDGKTFMIVDRAKKQIQFKQELGNPRTLTLKY